MGRAFISCGKIGKRCTFVQRISEPRPCPTFQRHRSVFFFRPCLTHVCLLPFIQTNTRSDAFFLEGTKCIPRALHISPLLCFLTPPAVMPLAPGPSFSVPSPFFLFFSLSEAKASPPLSTAPAPTLILGFGGPRIEMRLIYLAANDSTTLSHNKEPPGERGGKAPRTRESVTNWRRI